MFGKVYQYISGYTQREQTRLQMKGSKLSLIYKVLFGKLFKVLFEAVIWIKQTFCSKAFQPDLK